jgi:dephospho-CoA kinase
MVPLLVERGLQELFDLVVTVSAPLERRVTWAAADRGVSPERVRARAAVQAADEQRERVAQVVVRNEGSLEDLERSVDELWGRVAASVGRDRLPTEPA